MVRPKSPPPKPPVAARSIRRSQTLRLSLFYLSVVSGRSRAILGRSRVRASSSSATRRSGLAIKSIDIGFRRQPPERECGTAWLPLCTYRFVSKRRFSALRSAMAMVKVQWVTSGERVGEPAVVCIDVQTSVGKCAFPFQVDDRGSEQANEQEARRELQVFLREALQALGES